MALPTPIPRREIILDVTASTTAYAIPFPFIFDIDIEIAVSTVATPDSFTTLVYPSGYTLSGAGNPIGGTAHLTAAPEISGKVRIRGIAAENASEEIIRGIRYNYLSIEQALLRLGWGLQEVNREADDIDARVDDLAAEVDGVLETFAEAVETVTNTAIEAQQTAVIVATKASAAADAAALADQLANAAPNIPVGGGYSSRHWVALAQALAAAFDPSLYALLRSPAFTENPTGPTRSVKDNSASLATTAFVQGDKGYIRATSTFNSDGTLSAASIGYRYRLATAGITITLPDPTKVSLGWYLFACSATTANIATAVGKIYDSNFSEVAPLVLYKGDTVLLLSDGSNWVCSLYSHGYLPESAWVAGTSVAEAPISPTKLAATIAAALSNMPTLPPGTLAYWPAPTPPAGWLERDGSAISRTAYATLFAVIGTTCGAGDGTTTFNLPDDRGVFDRGWDHGKGYDSGRVFGSYQADEIKSHSHVVDRFGAGYSGSLNAQSWFGTSSGWATTADRSTGTTGGIETRPKNRAYLPIIKY